MDFWDPLFLDTLAADRKVIIFDNAGISRSSGSVPTTFQGWADDLIAFVRSLGIKKFDLLGFSMGGVVVQYVALTVPHMVRKLIVAGSRAAAPIVHRNVKPGGFAIEMERAPHEPIEKLRTSVGEEEEKKSLCYSFFAHTRAGKADFEEYWTRLHECKVGGEELNLRLLDRDAGAHY